MLRPTIILCAATVLVSCVSSGKFEKLDGEFKASQAANAELQKENDSLKAEISGLQDEVKQQGVLVETLKGRLGHASSNVEEMKTALKQAAERKRKRKGAYRNTPHFSVALKNSSMQENFRSRSCAGE